MTFALFSRGRIVNLVHTVYAKTQEILVMYKTVSYFSIMIFFITAVISINAAHGSDDDRDDGFEYNATITSVDYNKKTFVAGWHTFKARRAKIEAEHGPSWLKFCYIRPGQYLEVKGWPRAEYIVATEIEIKSGYDGQCHDPNGEKTKIKGKITQIGNKSIEVDFKYDITITNNTKFRKNADSISDLYNDQKVVVKGWLQTDGTIKAKVVKAKN